VLVGTDYWKGLLQWVEEIMLKQEKNINQADLTLINLVDSAEEAVRVIDDFYAKYLLSPNF
ncbi:MAG: TIGR00730 family Rossman fold protein, partial [Tunicatimonas sp.]